MKFYEWLHAEYGQDPYVHVEVDTEYYMIKAWNAAVQACLDEISQYVDAPPVIQSYLENLKQSEDVF